MLQIKSSYLEGVGFGCKFFEKQMIVLIYYKIKSEKRTVLNERLIKYEFDSTTPKSLTVSEIWIKVSIGYLTQIG